MTVGGDVITIEHNPAYSRVRLDAIKNLLGRGNTPSNIVATLGKYGVTIAEVQAARK